MHQIRKYVLCDFGTLLPRDVYLDLAPDSRVLEVAVQGSAITTWVLENPSLPQSEVHVFRLRGTGMPVASDWRHAATLMSAVWVVHVFHERGDLRPDR